MARYGIDAPGLVIGFLIGGTLALLLSCLGVIVGDFRTDRKSVV